MTTGSPKSAPYPVASFLKSDAKLDAKRLLNCCKEASDSKYELDVRVGIFFDGTNNNQLLFDDTDNQGRIQLKSSYAASGDACCVIWSKSADQPLRIRVVWSVIYDLDAFEGKLDNQRHKRSFKGRSRGSTWCEAIVDVAPASANVQADRVFHFLANGTVRANLESFASMQALPAAFVEQHATTLPEGQCCEREIDNPFDGISRKPTGTNRFSSETGLACVVWRFVFPVSGARLFTTSGRAHQGWKNYSVRSLNCAGRATGHESGFYVVRWRRPMQPALNRRMT